MAALGFPVFVKPARAGSSVGISKVHGPDELDDAIETARSHDPRVVVEAALEGREIECGVLEGLDGGPPEASVPAEVVVGGEHEFYDFAAKYLPDEGTDLIVPAELPDEVADRGAGARLPGVRRAVLRGAGPGRLLRHARAARSSSTRSTRCRASRPVSMFPLMWNASGLDYPALVDRLVQTALARDPGLLR